MSRIDELEAALEEHGRRNVSLAEDGTLQIRGLSAERVEHLLHQARLQLNKLVLAARNNLPDREVDAIELRVIEMIKELCAGVPVIPATEAPFPFKCVGLHAPCNEPLSWTTAYRCLDCGMWFCAFHLREHFSDSLRGDLSNATDPITPPAAVDVAQFVSATRGPWRIDPRLRAVEGKSIDGYRQICVNVHGGTASEMMANCKLIAAAPDLLKEVKKLRAESLNDRQLLENVWNALALLGGANHHSLRPTQKQWDKAFPALVMIGVRLRAGEAGASRPTLTELENIMGHPL